MNSLYIILCRYRKHYNLPKKTKLSTVNIVSQRLKFDEGVHKY